MADGVTSLEELVLAGDRSGAGAGGQRDVACPHCGASNPRLPDEGVAILDCVRCGRSFAQPRPPRTFATRTGAPRHSVEGIEARSPTDVRLPATGAAAAALTLVFYGVVIQPLSGTYFGELFGDRGWVPYVVTWLSIWAGLLLVTKALRLAAQRRTLELDWLPDSISERITPENAEVFGRHVRDLASRELARPGRLGALGQGAGRRSFLVERVARALDQLRSRGDAAAVSEQLASWSQVDATAVESSYTMIRVFIWAIPLLGFIGTVLGISEAVASFSDSLSTAVDLQVVKQSLGSVTTGLGVAFDTTLLALVMSILIMFPTSSLQKAEEDFLGRVDHWCQLRLARRLVAPPKEGPDAPLGEVAEQAARGLSRLEAQLGRLASTVEALDERLERSAQGKVSGDD